MVVSGLPDTNGTAASSRPRAISNDPKPWLSSFEHANERRSRNALDNPPVALPEPLASRLVAVAVPKRAALGQPVTCVAVF
jgi:hypothetical protein